MKLSCVLTSCTIDRPYYGCLPLFIRTWRKLYPGVKVKVVFVHETLPDELEPYREHVIHFPPVEGVPVKFTSQYVRLLYPAVLNEEGGVMITDVDLVPMNRRVFEDDIRHVADDAFVSDKEPYAHNIRWFQTHAEDGGHELPEVERRSKSSPQIPIAYNVACSKTWGDVFGVRTPEDVSAKLAGVYKEYYGKTNVWFIDQTDLHRAVKAWNEKTGGYVCLPYRPLPRRLWFELLQLRLFCDGLPNQLRRGESSGVKARVFTAFLYSCVKLECFIDFAVLSGTKKSHEELSDRIIGWLPSGPPSFFAKLFRPLAIVAWKTVQRALGLYFRMIDLNRRSLDL